MVLEATLQGNPVHVCQVCSLAYATPDLARRCEEHCKTHPSCSLAIGRQAVGSYPEAEAK